VSGCLSCRWWYRGRGQGPPILLSALQPCGSSALPLTDLVTNPWRAFVRLGAISPRRMRASGCRTQAPTAERLRRTPVFVQYPLGGNTPVFCLCRKTPTR
jgi:hypothetical protein